MAPQRLFPAHPDTMAVDLSSGGIQLPIEVLQGLRSGQSLGALLGYRFERGLHDRHGFAEVAPFIHMLQLQFPSLARKFHRRQL